MYLLSPLRISCDMERCITQQLVAILLIIKCTLDEMCKESEKEEARLKYVVLHHL